MPLTPWRMNYEDFVEEAPAARAALLALGKAVDDAGIDKALSELVKVRASQMNGCAFCLQLHLDVARRLGLSPRKLDLVVAWREADGFDVRERAALAWTEALTGLANETARAEAASALQSVFTREEVLHLTVAIATINSWNRIAFGLGFRPLG